MFINLVLPQGGGGGGGYSHRLYSHNCNYSRSAVKVAQNNAVNGQSALKVELIAVGWLLACNKG